MGDTASWCWDNRVPGRLSKASYDSNKFSPPAKFMRCIMHHSLHSPACRGPCVEPALITFFRRRRRAARQCRQAFAGCTTVAHWLPHGGLSDHLERGRHDAAVHPHRRSLHCLHQQSPFEIQLRTQVRLSTARTYLYI